MTTPADMPQLFFEGAHLYPTVITVTADMLRKWRCLSCGLPRGEEQPFLTSAYVRTGHWGWLGHAEAVRNYFE